MRPWTVLSILLFLVHLCACGDVRVGATTPPNDPVPSGLVVAQGTFSGLNGKTVSGNAAVYRDISTGTHTVRIEGITVPDEANLQVQAQANGQIALKTALRFKSGTQNYTTSVTDGRKWDSVSIVSTQNTQTPEYGKAALVNK